MSRLPVASLGRFLVPVALVLLSSCVVLRPAGYADFKTALKQADALKIYDTLEALIADDDDTRSDRKLAFRALRDREEDTAAFQFAWAAVAGRYVQYRGLLAVDLLKHIERHARRSVELDPAFRNGAATRLLGTMYVVAPSSFLEHGDSETGLEMLEGLVEKYPDEPQNHLRVAEAYIALNDPGPAADHLCACLAVKDTMRGEDQKLLTNLFADAGKVECPGLPPVPAPEKD
jgi:thioredoxin-like negative regulator of GroEL